MTTVALADIVDCLDRQRIPVKESERVLGDVPYYGANGQQGWIDRALFDEPLVIVAEDGGHFQNPARGVAYRVSGPSWVNNHGHVLRATKRVDHNYLFHALRTYDFAPYISGSTRSKLTQGQLLRAEIRLPPLGEQRRIAVMLDQADALHAKRLLARAHLDALTGVVYADMFGAQRKSWPSKPLGEVTECLDSRRRPVKESERPAGLVPYYGANGQQGWIDRMLFDEPLVLVAEDGGHFAAPERGVAYRINGAAWVNNHAHILRPGPSLAVEYLHRTLRHFDFSPYISGSTRSKLTQKQMKSARIPIPPLELQEEFAIRVELISALGDLHEQAAAKEEALRLSLRSNALSGKFATGR